MLVCFCTTMKITLVLSVFAVLYFTYVNADCPKCCAKKSSKSYDVPVYYHGDTCECGKTTDVDVYSLRSKHGRRRHSYKYSIKEPESEEDGYDPETYDFQRQRLRSKSSSRPKSFRYNVNEPEEDDEPYQEQEYDLKIRSIKPSRGRKLRTYHSKIDRVLIPKEGCNKHEDDLKENDNSALRSILRPVSSGSSGTCSCGCGQPSGSCDSDRRKRMINEDSDVLIIRGVRKFLSALVAKTGPTPITFTTGTTANNV